MTERSRNQKRRRKLAERERRLRKGNFDGINAAESDVQRELGKRLIEIRRPERTHEMAPLGIIWQDNPLNDLILAKGAIVVPAVIKNCKGRPHLCAENCAALFWVHFPKYRIATGYCYQSGMWGSHSWLMDGQEIVETTSTREVYFGVVLDEIDLTNFVINNFLSVFQTMGFRVQADNQSCQILLTHE